MSDKIIKAQTLEKRLGVQTTTSKSSVAGISSDSGLIRKEEISAQTKAQQIIAQAEADAEQIRKEAIVWKENIAKEREEAKQRGFEEGKQEGKGTFTSEILKTKALKEKYLQDVEPQLIKLVLTIAEKVIGDLAGKHQEVITEIVKQALERSLGEKIVIRLNPSDYERLREREGPLRELVERTKQLSFRGDENISAGGCIVETEIGTIDAQLETQMKAIKKGLGI